MFTYLISPDISNQHPIMLGLKIIKNSVTIFLNMKFLDQDSLQKSISKFYRFAKPVELCAIDYVANNDNKIKFIKEEQNEHAEMHTEDQNESDIVHAHFQFNQNKYVLMDQLSELLNNLNICAKSKIPGGKKLLISDRVIAKILNKYAKHLENNDKVISTYSNDKNYHQKHSIPSLYQHFLCLQKSSGKIGCSLQNNFTSPKSLSPSEFSSNKNSDTFVVSTVASALVLSLSIGFFSKRFYKKAESIHKIQLLNNEKSCTKRGLSVVSYVFSPITFVAKLCYESTASLLSAGKNFCYQRHKPPM